MTRVNPVLRITPRKGIPSGLQEVGISGSNGSFSAQTVTFGNSNGVSFYTTNGSLVASVVGSGGGGGAVLAAGTQTGNTSGTVVFSNSNGITFGMSNSSIITASHNGITTGRASTDGLGLNTAGTNITWTANSNGVSINAGGYAGTGFTSTTTAGVDIKGTNNTAGLSIAVPAFLTTAQAPGAYLTTAAQSNQVVNSLNGSTGQVSLTVASSLSFSSNGSTISFGLASNITTALQSTGAYLTTAALSNHSHNLATTTTNGSLIVVATTNSNGATFAVPPYITTGRASNDGIGLNTAKTNVTWTVNSSGLSLDGSGYAGTGTSATNASITLNSNGLAVSIANPSGIVPVVSNSAGSFSFTTLNFSNANNVTFGTSAGSIITASVAAPGAAAENNWVNLLGANTAGNTTASGSTIGYSGVNLTLSGTNGSVVNISAPATSSLSATGLVSISTNGSTISIGVADKTFANWEVFPQGNNSTFSSLGQNSFYLQKLNPGVNYSFNNFELRASGSFVSSTNSQVVAHTLRYGLYSLNGATYSSISTSEMFINASYNSNTAMGFTVSQGGASFTTTSGGTAIASLMSGFKHLYLPFTSTLTAGGKYAMGLHVSSATTVGTSPLRLAILNQTQMNNLTIGKIHATTLLASNASYVGDFMQGVGSVTTGAMPSSVAETALTNAVSQARLYIQLD